MLFKGSEHIDVFLRQDAYINVPRVHLLAFHKLMNYALPGYLVGFREYYAENPFVRVHAEQFSGFMIYKFIYYGVGIAGIRNPKKCVTFINRQLIPFMMKNNPSLEKRL